jgi:hypothetical protein
MISYNRCRFIPSRHLKSSWRHCREQGTRHPHHPHLQHLNRPNRPRLPHRLQNHLYLHYAQFHHRSSGLLLLESNLHQLQHVLPEPPP